MFLNWIIIKNCSLLSSFSVVLIFSTKWRNWGLLDFHWPSSHWPKLITYNIFLSCNILYFKTISPFPLFVFVSAILCSMKNFPFKFSEYKINTIYIDFISLFKYEMKIYLGQKRKLIYHKNESIQCSQSVNYKSILKVKKKKSIEYCMKMNVENYYYSVYKSKRFFVEMSIISILSFNSTFYLLCCKYSLKSEYTRN